MKSEVKLSKVKVKKILNLLSEYYGTEIRCFLEHENAWQLLIATILSAQCTDDRVNTVTRDLFIKYRSIAEIARADISELEKIIRPTGFQHQKAKNIIAGCGIIIERYSGEVPRLLEELTALPGVGRKTANVIRGNIFGDPSIVVDTHVKRVSKRLGFTQSNDPVKIEFDLMEVLPKDNWINFNKQIIMHGRTICKAQGAKCEMCFLQSDCLEVHNLN